MSVSHAHSRTHARTHARTQISYTTVAGKFVRGVDPVKGEGGLLAKLAGAGYQQVRGYGK
jgi:hypothetical protein